VNRLVHVEEYSTMDQAISREKRIKNWKRVWKIQLIKERNLAWDDLLKHLQGC